jgi:adenosylmethionine-8-amino-7-oxononanoate aminotransferase
VHAVMPKPFHVALFSRVRGDTFVLAPPFVSSDDQLDRIVETLAAATRAVVG